MKEKIFLNWSSGKDSAMALYNLKLSDRYDLLGLLTTVTQNYDRISMHGVRSSLLKKQAKSLGLPLKIVHINAGSSHEDYASIIKTALSDYKTRGISGAAFGDIFLEDLKKYREENLSEIGMTGIFPLWKRNTLDLAQEFIHLGFKAIVTCVDSEVLDGSFAGREFDKEFLASLPNNVDPCGENGEFHSFVYDGPIFKSRIPHKKGEVVLRDNRYYFSDLVPVEDNLPHIKT